MTIKEGTALDQWIEDAIGEPVINSAQFFGGVKQAPYSVLYDLEDSSGSDIKNLLSAHSLTLYRYTEDGVRNRKIDTLFKENGLEYIYTVNPTETGELIEERYQLESDIYERYGGI